jgi:predicted nucleic acid-binding protein
LVPTTVVTETCYLLARDAGIEAEALFLDAMASGFFAPVDLDLGDYVRMAELLRKYADRPLDATDASIVAVAERLDIADIITLDKTDFTLVRPNHVDAFTLLP